MIIVVICMFVTAGLCIRPAIRHDQDLPIRVTGKPRKTGPSHARVGT